MDQSRLGDFLSSMERLSGSRLYIVSLFGKVIGSTERARPSAPDEERLIESMLSLWRKSIDEAAALAGVANPGNALVAPSPPVPRAGPRHPAGAAMISVKGNHVGAVVPLGAERWPGASAHAVPVIETYVESLLGNEGEMESLSREILERYEEVNLLYELSEALGAVHEVETIARVAIEKGLCATKARNAAVLLEDEESGGWNVVAVEGAQHEGLLGGTVAADDRFITTILEAPTGTVWADYADFPDVILSRTNGPVPYFMEPPVLAMPMRVGERTFGILIVSGSETGKPFSAGEMKILNSITSQTALSMQSCELIEQAKRTERVKRDIELAETIQSRLLPAEPPSAVGVDIAGGVVHPTMVGGDYYDYIPAACDCVTFVMADVTGHNFGSALIMAMARAVLRGEILKGGAPDEILASSSSILYDDLTNSDLLITVFLAQWNGAARVLRYANAGHNPPLLWRSATGQVEMLDAEGMIIGAIEDPLFEQKTVPFEPGDVLLLYTDGVTEAKNEAGEMFGDARLVQTLTGLVALSAQEILQGVFDAVDAFRGDVAIHDDLSLVVVCSRT